MDSKLLLVSCLILACGCQSGISAKTDFTGSQILQGFVKTFQYLLTPHHSDQKSDLPREIQLHQTAEKVEHFKQKFISDWKNGAKYDPDQNIWFKAIPKYITNLELGQEYKTESNCFKDITASANKNDDGTVTVKFNLQAAESLLCRTAVLVSVDADTQVAEYLLSGEKEMTFAAPEGDANAWDLYERGPRLFIFPMTLETAIANLAATLALFEPCLTQGVSNYFAEMNLEFLKNYVGIEMPERENAPEIMPIDINSIHSGDTFHIMRLDGLDPMIGWAMGSATGHVAMALWKDEELFMCESNAKSPYWPVNGIQCNAYTDWIEYGRRNDYNVVWAPLSRELSANFDEDSAWEFVDAHLGVDYGWEVILTGWLDIHDGNRVCADTASTMCTEKEHFEMIFSVAEKLLDAAARVFKPAIMQRAGVDFNLPIVEAYYKAATELGIEPADVHLIPEEDSNIYPTTRDGVPFDSDVSICNVFTCKVLKASGVLGNVSEEFNCGEISVNDNYRMKVFEENFERPLACVNADPENPLCQILGKYSLRLDSQPGIPPRYNYVDLHNNFADNCPSLAPDYEAPIDC